MRVLTLERVPLSLLVTLLVTLLGFCPSKCKAEESTTNRIISNEEFLTRRGSDDHQEVLINVNHVIDYLHSIKKYQEEVAHKVDVVTRMIETSDREEYRNRLKTIRRVSVLESKVTEMERTLVFRMEEVVDKKLQEFLKSKDSSVSVPQPPPVASPFHRPAGVSNLPRNSRDISYFEPFRPNIARTSDSSAIPPFRSMADRQSYLSIHLLEDSKLKMSLMNETLQSFKNKLREVERKIEGKPASLHNEEDAYELSKKQMRDKLQHSEKEISELKSKQSELRRSIDTVLIHFSTLMNGLDDAHKQIEETQRNFRHEIQQVLKTPRTLGDIKQPTQPVLASLPSPSALTDTRDSSPKMPSHFLIKSTTEFNPAKDSGGGVTPVENDVRVRTMLSNLTNEISSQKQQISKLSSDLARMNISQILLMRTMDEETMKRTIRPKDCSEIRLLRNDTGTARKYTIFPNSNDTPLQVLCDMETSGGGWTTIQRRGYPLPPGQRREDFYRNWTEYQHGFGSLQQDFWLGLDNTAALCALGDQELRIEMTNWGGERRVALYSHFRIEDSANHYRLTVSGYSGNAGDSLSRHDGMAFSTKDNDHDTDPHRNCAQMWKGAWWYYGCHESNLNGVYGREDSNGSDEFGTGIIWYHWTGNYYSLKTVSMKIRNSFVVKHNQSISTQ